MAKKPQSKPETEAQEAPAKAAKLVRMVRDESYPEPHSADVHPDEVDNFAAGGWVKA
jgi:hypothetical protein